VKNLIALFYIILVVIVFTPREKLYRTIESTLGHHNLFLSGETLQDAWLYLDVQNIEVVLDKSVIGSIENLRLSSWFFIHSIHLSSFKVASEYKVFFPGVVDDVRLTYALYNPLHIAIVGSGDFGACEGDVDLMESRVRLVFEPTPALRHYPYLVSKLHKEEEGLVYEVQY